MKKKQATVICILTIIAIVMAVLVSRRLWFRLDLTGAQFYTLSQVSKDIHNEITGQVQITYFVSDRLKAIYPMPGEIEDLLREYVSHSRGKIRLAVRDPAKEQNASMVEQLGIMPQQIRIVEQDQDSVATVYTGILIEYLDAIEVLPVVFAVETLEYELTSRIRSMIRNQPRQIGILFGGDPQRWGEDYQHFQAAFRQAGYTFQMIMPGMDIPDTIPALMVLDGVETFDDATLYSIDRYIQAGGRVLFTAKSIAIDKETDLSARLLNDGGLLAMLSSYGISVLPEIAMDRSALIMQYQIRGPTGAMQYMMARYPQWIRVLGENGNPSHPVTAFFGGLDLYWPSPLYLDPPEGVEAEHLFTSTEEAWSMHEPFYTSPDVAYLLERDAADTKGTKILGASATGTFPSFFAGRPKPDSQFGMELADIPGEAKPARIIVIGETDFATSLMAVSDGFQNLDFLVLAADWLRSDDDIIGIRSRQGYSNRLENIVDPLERAAAMRNIQIINVVIMPLLVIFAGIFVAMRRRAATRSHAADAGTDKTKHEKGHHHDI